MAVSGANWGRDAYACGAIGARLRRPSGRQSELPALPPANHVSARRLKCRTRRAPRKHCGRAARGAWPFASRRVACSFSRPLRSTLSLTAILCCAKPLLCCAVSSEDVLSVCRRLRRGVGGAPLRIECLLLSRTADARHHSIIHIISVICILYLCTRKSVIHSMSE